jgi:hypothetical protein
MIPRFTTAAVLALTACGGGKEGGHEATGETGATTGTGTTSTRATGTATTP